MSDTDRVAELTAQVDKLLDRIDRLEWENKGIAEWRDEALRAIAHRDRLLAALKHVHQNSPPGHIHDYLDAVLAIPR